MIDDLQLDDDQEKMKKTPLVISICSGKGGVGKSVLCSNIGLALAEQSVKTLVWDADSYFPNQHLLMGVEPSVRLNAVYAGQVSVSTAIYEISANFSLLADQPAAEPEDQERKLSIEEVYINLIKETDFDVIVIDTGAAGNDSVLECCAVSDIIALVVNDEPTSLLDAYGLTKILLHYFESSKIKMIVNNVIDNEDADEIETKLNMATENFLKTKLETIGYVPYDRIVRQSILKQELFMLSDPKSDLSNSIRRISNYLNEIININ